MFTTGAQLTNVIAIENVRLQIGEVDGFGVDSAHPAPRADLMSDKCRPDGFSDDGELERSRGSGKTVI